jgi:hypothetical protein
LEEEREVIEREADAADIPTDPGNSLDSKTSQHSQHMLYKEQKRSGCRQHRLHVLTGAVRAHTVTPRQACPVRGFEVPLCRHSPVSTSSEKHVDDLPLLFQFLLSLSVSRSGCRQHRLHVLTGAVRAHTVTPRQACPVRGFEIGTIETRSLGLSLYVAIALFPPPRRSMSMTSLSSSM